MLNAFLIAIALLFGMILLSRRIRDNKTWRAIVTPLASIIGSGFLVIVPLLGNAVGGYAPLAMAGVVGLAYVVGSAIRFNISYAEPLLASPGASSTAVGRLDSASALALGVAYFISVTFYLRLLASFVLRGLEVESEWIAQSMTSVILISIGVAGWVRGLSFLERLEEYSVSIKLAIIGALIIGWGVYDVPRIEGFHLSEFLPQDLDWWRTVRLMAGVLIVVQGFETSRYLGDEYDARVRVSTMRYAQIIAAFIYIVFVALTVPAFGQLEDEVNETAIIDLSAVVATALAPMLIVAAVMSQLSAAVADTVGTGGLFSETLGRRFKLTAKVGYLLVSAVGVVLVWTVDIFEIIALASRSFALYYALQCAVAAKVAAQRASGSWRMWLLALGFGALALVLLVAVGIAIPAGA